MRHRRSHRAASLSTFAAALFLASCSHPEIDRLKTGVVGIWVDVTDPKATLQFNPDGVLIMQNTRQKNFCNYDFPDAKHLRIDCADAGQPRHPQLWNFELGDDTISIGDTTTRDTGHYHRQ